MSDPVSPVRQRIAEKHGYRGVVSKNKETESLSPCFLFPHVSPTDKPNQKWVSDITYIATDEGWLYLAGVMDLCGRAIVGFAMAEHMKKSLVIAALNQAIRRTGAKEGLLVHSDRGVQYASKEYQALLNKNQFICSMSRKGNCYDNAPMESF